MGSTYEDFCGELQNIPGIGIVEMDTVEEQ